MNRNSATKQRRQLMSAFIDEHRQTIAALLAIENQKAYKSAWKSFVDDTVRKQIPYSPKTVTDDIRIRIIRHLREHQ